MRWGQLAKYRARLILGAYAPDCDKPTELKARLKLWEQGNIVELATRVSAMCLQIQEKRKPSDVDDTKAGDIARKKAW